MLELSLLYISTILFKSKRMLLLIASATLIDERVIVISERQNRHLQVAGRFFLLGLSRHKITEITS